MKHAFRLKKDGDLIGVPSWGVFAEHMYGQCVPGRVLKKSFFPENQGAEGLGTLVLSRGPSESVTRMNSGWILLTSCRTSPLPVSSLVM